MCTERRRGFTLIELLVVVAIIALLVSILMPSLGRARDMAQAAVCANRHKGSVMGWAYYGSDYNGVYMAPWDRPPWGNSWPGLGPNYWQMQYIYTFLHYANGGGLPRGETVWMSGRPGGPWYSEDGGTFPAALIGWPPVVPQVRCPQIDALGTGANFLWYGTASQSYFDMGRYRTPAGNWAYGGLLGYPQPDLMTHPATTGLMMCMTTVPGENRPNVWAHYRNDPYDPHMDESNYSFVDGHVERLPQSSTYRYMWLSMWDRSDPDYIDRYIPQPR